MKVWNSYGSEHSANLVMIGHFRDAGSAEESKDVIEELRDFIGKNQESLDKERYSSDVLNLLSRLHFHSVGAGELEQFIYDYRIELDGNNVVITTEEVDVSALFKLLIDRGARVEIYSAHDYPDTGRGRKKKKEQ